MKFRVLIESSARAEMLDAFEWIWKRSPNAAARWYASLEEALHSLERLPRRCHLAPEDDAFKEEIRQLLFGKAHKAYRALFTVREDEAHVLHFRHTAQLPMNAPEAERDD